MEFLRRRPTAKKPRSPEPSSQTPAGSGTAAAPIEYMTVPFAARVQCPVSVPFVNSARLDAARPLVDDCLSHSKFRIEAVDVPALLPPKLPPMLVAQLARLPAYAGSAVLVTAHSATAPEHGAPPLKAVALKNEAVLVVMVPTVVLLGVLPGSVAMLVTNWLVPDAPEPAATMFQPVMFGMAPNVEVKSAVPALVKLNPDVIHDVFGPVALLTVPGVTRFSTSDSLMPRSSAYELVVFQAMKNRVDPVVVSAADVNAACACVPSAIDTAAARTLSFFINVSPKGLTDLAFSRQHAARHLNGR